MTDRTPPRFHTSSVSLTAGEAELVEAGLWQVRDSAEAEGRGVELARLLRRVQRAQRRALDKLINEQRGSNE